MSAFLYTPQNNNNKTKTNRKTKQKQTKNNNKNKTMENKNKTNNKNNNPRKIQKTSDPPPNPPWKQNTCILFLLPRISPQLPRQPLQHQTNFAGCFRRVTCAPFHTLTDSYPGARVKLSTAGNPAASYRYFQHLGLSSRHTTAVCKCFFFFFCLSPFFGGWVGGRVFFPLTR